ncbi:unnamed protein product, partial [Sphacelaria rigidula]
FFIATLGYLVYRLGFAYLIPQHWKRLRLTAEQAEQEIAGHTFLFVGGPHRGGTTILWKCLREHPLISGFGDRVGTDYSEGIFLQSVYPTFGIGGEKVHPVGRPTTRRRSALAAGVENARGLGAYGFNPNHHLTEEDVTPRARTVLMNEWGYLWDLSRPVLMEKSPPNMIISTFLQEIFSAGDHPRVDETAQTQMAVPGGKYDGSDGGSTTRARFLFISRHPIANALALAKYLAGGLGSDGLPDMFEQVLHWVVSHEIMREDMERLEHARVIRFEDFVLDPQGHLAEIVEWLDVKDPTTKTATTTAAATTITPEKDGGADELQGKSPSSISSTSSTATTSDNTPSFVFETRVSRDTNRKYEAQYCEALRRFPSALTGHRQLVAKLGPRVQAQGYDLDSFPCVKTILERAKRNEEREHEQKQTTE